MALDAAQLNASMIQLLVLTLVVELVQLHAAPFWLYPQGRRYRYVTLQTRNVM
jgi:hypothetical protein